MQHKKAFDYEQGQFICHIYAKIQADTAACFENIVTKVLDDPETTCWEPLPASQSGEEPEFHVTLVRGHRAVYYHQIKPLLERVKDATKVIGPFTLCLDELMIFNNCEQSKQFLCLASRRNSVPRKFYELKEQLRICIDTFATKLTDEDETPDTIAHCSILQRDMTSDRSSGNQIEADLARISKLCHTKDLDLLEACFVSIYNIYLKVGNKEYSIDMS